jgi:predicted nuclease of predicted toxin-antitoxin system
MAKPKIFIDEDVHDGLGDALRREGFDAITAREAGRKQFSDAEQLEFAIS